MEDKRGLVIAALILVFIFLANTNTYTGKGSVRVSGTCHSACCYLAHPKDAIKVDCYEKYIKENPGHHCTGNPDSLNSGCTIIPFEASENIPGAGGLAGVYVRKSDKPAKSSVQPGLYLHTCYANTGTRPIPSKGSVYSNPQDCKGKICEIKNGQAGCV